MSGDFIPAIYTGGKPQLRSWPGDSVQRRPRESGSGAMGEELKKGE